MNSFKFQSFLFTGVMLALVVMAKIDKESAQKTSFQANIKNTSLIAEVRSSASGLVAAAGYPERRVVVSTANKFQQSAVSVIDDLDLRASLKAKAVFVGDLDGNEKMWAFSEGDRWPIASLTKLMSAVITEEKIGSDKKIIVSERANGVLSSNINLVTGEVYSAGDLIKAMLVVSSNNAAEALAEFYGEKNFVDEMQRKSADLGMNQTTFFDPTGLSFLNQSSAEDLVKLVKYVVASHPDFLDISTKKDVELLELNSGKRKILKNINYFAGQDDFLGGKTGFIDSSRGNLISIFSYSGHRIFIIVLGAEDRFKETQTVFDWIKNNFKLSR